MRRPHQTPGGRRRAVVATIAALVAGLSFAYAQQQRIWVNPGLGDFRQVPPKWVKADDFDGSFMYCRGYFEQVRYEDGGMGWWTDYPNADHNFSVRLAELTRVRTRLDKHHEPNFVVVALTDPLLNRCGIVFMEDVGTLQFSEEQVSNLRQFFLKGGFLWVDDFWGTRAWDYWAREIGRVLPPGEFPIFDIPRDHSIMHTLYDVKEVPQIPSINFWYGGGFRGGPSRRGGTSERGEDSAEVHFRGIQDSHKHLMVLMSHNTDVADTWEREGESREYFDLFSPRGYAIGVNAILYAMTH